MLQKLQAKVSTGGGRAITYDGMIFDEGLRLDFIVEELIIYELKAVDEMNFVWEAQILRDRQKITSHFNIPSSGHLRPIRNRKILEIVPLLVTLLAGQFRIEQI